MARLPPTGPAHPYLHTPYPLGGRFLRLFFPRIRIRIPLLNLAWGKMIVR